MNFISALQPINPKHVTIVDGMVTKISLNQFNQKVTSLTLQLWPALLILSRLERVGRRTVTVLCFVILTGPVLLSEHDSSKVALLVSIVAFVLASLWDRASVFAVAGLWCASFLLVIPLDTAAYRAGWHQSQWLPSSFRARIVIWEHTADQIDANPWFGVGVRSTQEMQKPATPTVEMSEGPGRGLGRHAHSLFLQTWFELGAIGAVLAALAGGAVATRIRLLRKRSQPFGVATFVAFATIAAFAWGVWETWWMATVGLAALYLCLGAAVTSSGMDENLSPFKKRDGD
jgi:O-antigen ligase